MKKFKKEQHIKKLAKLLILAICFSMLTTFAVSASATDNNVVGNNIGELDPSMLARGATTFAYSDICHKQWDYNAQGYRIGASGWTNILDGSREVYHYSNLLAHGSLSDPNSVELYSGRKWGCGKVIVSIRDSNIVYTSDLKIYFGWES